MTHGRAMPAVAVLVLVLGLVACGDGEHFPTVQEAATHFGADPAWLVQADELRWVAITTGPDDAVTMLGFGRDGGGWTRILQVERHVGDHDASVLFASIDDAGAWAGEYVFGTAPASVARVVLDGVEGGSATVVDGRWVMVPAARFASETAAWRMVGTDGAPVTVGIGEVPPQP